MLAAKIFLSINATIALPILTNDDSPKIKIVASCSSFLPFWFQSHRTQYKHYNPKGWLYLFLRRRVDLDMTGAVNSIGTATGHCFLRKSEDWQQCMLHSESKLRQQATVESPPFSYSLQDLSNLNHSPVRGRVNCVLDAWRHFSVRWFF